MSTEETLLESIQDAMEDHGLRPTQHIDSLLKAIEEDDEYDGQDDGDDVDDE